MVPLKSDDISGLHVDGTRLDTVGNVAGQGGMRQVLELEGSEDIDCCIVLRETHRVGRRSYIEGPISSQPVNLK